MQAGIQQADVGARAPLLWRAQRHKETLPQEGHRKEYDDENPHPIREATHSALFLGGLGLGQRRLTTPAHFFVFWIPGVAIWAVHGFPSHH